MREVKGYSCVAEYYIGLHLVQIMFGPKVDPEVLYCHESLYSNGIKVFEFLEDARESAANIRSRRKFGNVWIARLQMKIAQNEDEIGRAVFIRSRSLVVINKTSGGDRFLGIRVEGKPSAYPLLGADLRFNGLSPIDSYRYALEIANEACRQTDHAATTIATFHLHSVDTK